MAKKTPTTRTFTKTIDGVEQTQLAYSPADAVRFTYDGWREVTEQAEPAAAKPARSESGKTSK